jgi:LPXTG-site transpeptidase (sortase) family protein
MAEPEPPEAIVDTSSRRVRILRYAPMVSGLLAAMLVAGGTLWAATPRGGGSPDIREIPGAVSVGIQEFLGTVKPESGYPRIKVNRVNIDLLLVKGDGKQPPVVYEAFTFPGADHLLASSQAGGGNSYVYAHARSGMFWRLHDMRIGDIVEVDYGAGRILRYRVSEIHPKVDFHEFKWLQPTSDDRLTLQTCNGWRDEDPRFIVVAKRISDGTA